MKSPYSLVLACLLAPWTLAVAQVRPATPAPPAYPAEPAYPIPAPLGDMWFQDEIRTQVERSLELSREVRERALEQSQQVRDQSQAIREQSAMAREQASIAREFARAEATQQLSLMQPPYSIRTTPSTPGSFTIGQISPDGKYVTRAPAPQWYQGDPADSAYRNAYANFSRGEWRSAADRFASVRSRYSTSNYFCDAAYFEAFARYRIGSVADLKTGYSVLESTSARCTGPAASTSIGGAGANVVSGALPPPGGRPVSQAPIRVASTTTNRNGRDVPELISQINAALARLGDSDAAARLQRTASQGQNICIREDRDVQIAALSAIAQMDPQGVVPQLKGVLAKTDECSAPVRLQAIQLVTRRNDADAVALLSQVARTDPDRNNQMEAVRALGRMSNDAAYTALQEFFRTTTDQRTQTEAISAMARSTDPRSRAAVQSLIERKDVAEQVRISAISSLATQPGMTDYWRTLYSKVESDELRRAVVSAIGRDTTDATRQFLLRLAGNPAEPSSVREAALSRARSTAPIADLYRIFQTADSRAMRLSIVTGLTARREPEATDRLIDIANNVTEEAQVRNAAISALGKAPRNSDPKVQKALSDLLAGVRR